MRDLLPVLPELTRLGRALTGAVKRDTVARAVADCLQRTFGAERGAVALLGDGRGRQLEIAAAFGDPTPDATDPFLGDIQSARATVRQVTGAAIGTPLVAAGHTLGILAIWGKGQHAFDDADGALIEVVAAQAAIALQNTQLIELLSTGKQEWEQMVDAIRPAICILDGKGAVRRANRAFADLVGTPLTALTGRPWLMLVPPAWAEAIGEALRMPDTGFADLRADQRIFAVRAHPVAGQDATVLLIENVTDTRRLQDQLIQSEKLSAIGQLIAGVAHELNNPLASVLGFADFLSETGRMPASLAEPLRVIQQEANRAAGIVRNLLTFVRSREQERRRVDLGPVLERTMALLNTQFIDCKVDPMLVVEPGLPPVEGSPNQLQQVFLNIINNAAQAIAASGRPGTVVVRARPWLDGAAVDVTDNGPGIAPEHQERVFEPFFTTKADGAGTGLGLSICQGIIREHQGRITLSSTPGHGTTFTVELPPAGGAAHEEAPAAPAPLRAARVLVVDDEPHILHYMRATLEAWGHRVETACDGEDGLQRALTEPFDLIITDVRMPRLSGREFYERLRDGHPAVAERVVFATGDTVRDDTLAFLEATGRPFLNKPFKLAELRSALSSALETGP